MAKRGATSELTDRNWDQEEEPEEAGTFAQAATDVLQTRVIKRAKRRGNQEEGGDNRKPAVFGGFGGLSTSKSFGGPTLTKSATIGSGMTFGGFGGGKTTTGSSTGMSAAPLTFGAATKAPSLGAASSQNGRGEGGKKASLDSGDSDGSTTSSYFHALKALNESVLAWIKQHVDENPYIFLTPIFKDYQTHLDAIEAKRSEAGVPSAPASTFSSVSGPTFTSSVEKPAVPPADSNASNAKSAPFSTSSLAKADSPDAGNGKAEDSKASAAKPFTFGLSGSQTEAKPASFGGLSSSNGGFKFSSSSTSSPGTGFNFGATAKPDSGATTSLGATSGFSFGGPSGSGGSSSMFAASSSSSGAQGSGGQKTDKDDEEYEPPKVEVKEIKEDDALYSKRCKLYYQRDGQWVDRGVGNIHLKPVGDSKTQLLVRADTNLGNILLNIMLSASLPFSRQGKNNVFLACVPNPPLSSKPDEAADSTPVPMLIRVKNAEDADELKGKLDERVELLS